MFNLDESLRNELKNKLSRLQPYQIGERGQLQEWIYDFKEAEPQHRHFSHLYGFHPSDQITPDRTPELFNAVRKTLELRGDLASGWSMGWKINCWARLLDAIMPTRSLPTCSILSDSETVRIKVEDSSVIYCAHTLLSRSTATSAIRQVSLKCCCKATPATFICCQLYPMYGRKVLFLV